MIIRFIGDVHRKWGRYALRLLGPKNTLQVGDFGVGFKYYDYKHGLVAFPNEPVADMEAGNNFFIRGNHDNPEYCERNKFWIPDGETCFDGRVFCVGGAESYDKDQRTEGLDWWPDEELSYVELQEIIDKYEALKPNIVATHDAPGMLMEHLVETRKFPYTVGPCGRNTRNALQIMWEIHQPKLWVHGHWHIRHETQIKDTLFIGLEELGIYDYET